jgi:hypothetical protein
VQARLCPISHFFPILRCKHAFAPLPAIRIDILVKRVSPGKAEVHTLELTELGFSMLSWRDGPDAVFASVLASCFDDTGPTEEDSRRLALLEYRKGETTSSSATTGAPPGMHAGSSSDEEGSSTGGADTGGGGDGGAIAELRRRAIAAAQMAVDGFP